MKRILVTMGFLFALGDPTGARAIEIRTADAPVIQSAMPPQRDAIVEEDVVSNFSPVASITQLPYRGAIESRYMVAPRSDPVYRDFLARLSVSEAMGSNTAPIMRLALNSRVGVQWSLDGQRPSLEYRFSDNAVMRFRGSRHGARLVMHSTF